MDSCFCTSSIYSPVELEQACMRPKECSLGEIGIMSLIQDINTPGGYEAYEAENSMIEELRMDLEQDLQFKDDSKLLFGHELNLDQNERHNTSNEYTCKELQFIEVSELNINMKNLDKYATFPCSEERGLSSVSVKGTEERSVMLKQSHCHVKDTDSASAKAEDIYERSSSLPSSLKLVSAMKGGRQQPGQLSKEKFNVKWAPDVYDPPITLMSHTVKNHHQRPKPKKKDRNKNKHKTKSSRGNVRDKKHVNRMTTSSNTGPSFLRVQAPVDKLLLDGFAQSGVEETLDYAVSGAESKCGSSFLIGSLAEARHATAEAS